MESHQLANEVFEAWKRLFGLADARYRAGMPYEVTAYSRAQQLTENDRCVIVKSQRPYGLGYDRHKMVYEVTLMSKLIDLRAQRVLTKFQSQVVFYFPDDRKEAVLRRLDDDTQRDDTDERAVTYRLDMLRVLAEELVDSPYNVSSDFLRIMRPDTQNS